MFNISSSKCNLDFSFREYFSKLHTISPNIRICVFLSLNYLKEYIYQSYDVMQLMNILIKKIQNCYCVSLKRKESQHLRNFVWILITIKSRNFFGPLLGGTCVNQGLKGGPMKV